MRDTIYREDAIKAINLRARIPHDVASAYYASMAIDAIRSVPSAARPQGEWIPCSERLPSDDNDYLVVDGDGEMAVGYYRDDADAWDNSCFGWLERDDEDEHPTRLGKVVAWMPLPEPWKGADNDN